MAVTRCRSSERGESVVGVVKRATRNLKFGVGICSVSEQAASQESVSNGTFNVGIASLDDHSVERVASLSSGG